MKKCILFLLLCFIIPFANAGTKPPAPTESVKAFADHVFDLSEVMLHDVVDPPAASRFYAYSMLAAYQVVLAANDQIPDFCKKFKEPPTFAPIPLPEKFDPVFAATYAMLEAGKNILPSGYLLQEKQDMYQETYKKQQHLSKKAIAANIAYAEVVAKQVLQYAQADGYNKLSTYTRYTPTQKEGSWYPTPPAYISAIQPNWQDIRSFFIDSASQFPPARPVPFSKDTSSSFHALMMDVYNTVNHLTEEQRTIASFWDCNPFAVQFSGHMAIGLKKISPGGHWMGITGIACQKAKVSFDSAVMIHTLVALTLHDAFISCWQEKYRSDRIRPETAINRYYDQTWRPILQTPPFPEYTSGHSVVSNASAVILTNFLGDNFNFDDTSEVYFGLPVRKFTSFYQAASEAAISRLYGGIHFRDAVDEGVVEGKDVAHFILQKLNSKDLSGR